MYGMTVSVLFMFLGYPQFLLPLMITFAAARYTGNAINAPMYDMHIHLKQWYGAPFTSAGHVLCLST